MSYVYFARTLIYDFNNNIVALMAQLNYCDLFIVTTSRFGVFIELSSPVSTLN